MSPRKKYGRIASVLAMAVLMIVATVAPAAAQRDGRGRGRTPRSPEPPVTSPAPAPPSVDDADAEFVSMMIPHHHQALLMSRMAPTQSGDRDVRALASRIDIEQSLEIMMMQNWQQWNGLSVTNAEQAYQMMLGMPAMLEQMGMATPAEMSALSSSSGTAFDRLYLELMIEHHQGALTMLEEVILNGSDPTLRFWATDMLTAQDAQIWQMEQMLDDIT